MDGLKDAVKKIPSIDARLLIRLIVVVFCAVIGALALLSVAPLVLNFLFHSISRVVAPGRVTDTTPFPFNALSFVGFTLLGVLIGAYVGGRIIAAIEWLGALWDRMEVSDKVTLFIGIFAGIVVSIPFLEVLQQLDLSSQSRPLVIVAVVVGLICLTIYMLQTMADVLPWNRAKGRHKRSGVKILDTNVIIDGRIYDVAKTGFLDGQMYVPGFVLEELQYIADSHDALRRQRGRRGLDVLKHMQAEFAMDIRIHDKLAPEQGDGVDSRLVRLAKSLGGDIVTNDFNLNRVAALQDVKVMNLNDLALALRPNVLPTETLELYLSREGNQIGQGVGYLDDGTMVVVENGKPHLGETVDVVVTQVIQTERGKMIFAEVPGEPDPTVRRRVGQRRQAG